MSTKIVDCACFGEGLRVQWEQDDRDFYVSKWGYIPQGKPTWRYRIKVIWKVLTTGDPYHDELILHADDAKQLADWILDKAKLPVANSTALKP